MITFNILNVLVLIAGWIVIHCITDTEELAILRALFFDILWLVIWILVFIVGGINLHFSITH